MIKGIATARRKAGMGEADFHRYWRQTHGPLALKMSKLRRYVQSHRIAPDLPGFETCPYDGVAEIWFDDLATLQNMPNDPEYTQYAQADEPNFVDMDSLIFLATHEHVVIEGPPIAVDTPLVKMIFLFRRKPGMSVADFQDYWLNGHAPQIPRDAGVMRYVQCHQLAETYADGEPVFDGVAELSFADLDAFNAYWGSERIQAIFAEDAPRFMDLENTTGFLAEDYRVRWPS